LKGRINKRKVGFFHSVRNHSAPNKHEHARGGKPHDATKGANHVSHPQCVWHELCVAYEKQQQEDEDEEEIAMEGHRHRGKNET